MSRNVGEMA